MILMVRSSFIEIETIKYISIKISYRKSCNKQVSVTCTKKIYIGIYKIIQQK